MSYIELLGKKMYKKNICFAKYISLTISLTIYFIKRYKSSTSNIIMQYDYTHFMLFKHSIDIHAIYIL